MSDVLIFQTTDGGDIEIEGGVVTTGGGLASAVYLSLFGGNEQDDGREGNPATWWGNVVGQEQYRSRTQHLLRSIPAIPANLRRIEDAARKDLNWMMESGAAGAIDVVATQPGLSTVKLVVIINNSESFEYLENWRAELS